MERAIVVAIDIEITNAKISEETRTIKRVKNCGHLV